VNCFTSATARYDKTCATSLRRFPMGRDCISHEGTSERGLSKTPPFTAFAPASGIRRGTSPTSPVKSPRRRLLMSLATRPNKPTAEATLSKSVANLWKHGLHIVGQRLRPTLCRYANRSFFEQLGASLALLGTMSALPPTADTLLSMVVKSVSCHNPTHAVQQTVPSLDSSI
jgi:hypothetical protein